MLKSVAPSFADAIALHVKKKPPLATVVSSQLHANLHLGNSLVLLISR